MAEALREVGVEGGWALPPDPLRGLAAAERAGLLLRAGALRVVLLRVDPLLREAGRALAAGAGAAAGVVAGEAAGAPLALVALTAGVGGAGSLPEATTGGEPSALGAAAEAVLLLTGLLLAVLLLAVLLPAASPRVELLEGVAAMLVVRVRRGGRLAMGERDRRLGRRGVARWRAVLVIRPAPRNR